MSNCKNFLLLNLLKELFPHHFFQPKIATSHTIQFAKGYRQYEAELLYTASFQQVTTVASWGGSEQ